MQAETRSSGTTPMYQLRISADRWRWAMEQTLNITMNLPGVSAEIDLLPAPTKFSFPTKNRVEWAEVCCVCVCAGRFI